MEAGHDVADVSISMSLHLGDVMRETAHLSAAEMGAHMRLAMAAWARGGYLPNDQERLRRLAGVDIGEWDQIWKAISELWGPGEAGIFHARTLAEIERARAKKASYQARGKRGGRPTKEEAEAKARAKLAESSAFAEGEPKGKATAEGKEEVGGNLPASGKDGQSSGSDLSSESSTPEESSALTEGEAGGKTPPPPPTPDPDRGSKPPIAPQPLRLIPEESQVRQTEADVIRAVFAHYRTHYPRSYRDPQPTSKEWRQIRARLHEGITGEEICRAIDGYMVDPFSQGQNDRHTKYDGLDLITRDEAHVRKGIGFLARRPAQQADPRHGRVDAKSEPTLVGGVQEI